MTLQGTTTVAFVAAVLEAAQEVLWLVDKLLLKGTVSENLYASRNMAINLIPAAITVFFWAALAAFFIALIIRQRGGQEQGSSANLSLRLATWAGLACCCMWMAWEVFSFVLPFHYAGAWGSIVPSWQIGSRAVGVLVAAGLAYFAGTLLARQTATGGAGQGGLSLRLGTKAAVAGAAAKAVWSGVGIVLLVTVFRDGWGSNPGLAVAVSAIGSAVQLGFLGSMAFFLFTLNKAQR